MGMDYDRLLRAAKELKDWKNQAEVVIGLSKGGYDVSAQTMTNWASRGVSKEGRLNASRIIGCRPLWIETGEGAMKDISENPNISNTEPAPHIKGRVPLISWVQAGAFCGIIDQFEPGDAEMFYVTNQNLSIHAFCLRVKGDSMVNPIQGGPTYPENSIIFVDPETAVTNGCRVVAKLPDTNEATFKVYSEDAGKKFLKPLNPQYPIIEMTEDMQICGVVRAVLREE